MALNVPSSSQVPNPVFLSSESAQSLISPLYTATSIPSSSEPNSIAHVAPPSPRSLNSPNVSPDGGNATLPTEDVRLSSLTAEERKRVKGKMRAIDPPADNNNLEGSPHSVVISTRGQEAANTLLRLQLPVQPVHRGSSAGPGKLSAATGAAPQPSSFPVSDPKLVQPVNIPFAAVPMPTREDRRPIAGTRRKAKLAAVGKLVMPSPSFPPEMSEAEESTDASQALRSELDECSKSQSVNTQAVAQFDEKQRVADQQLEKVTLRELFGGNTPSSPHNSSVDVPQERDTERQPSTSYISQAPSPKPADDLHNHSRLRQKATEPNSKAGAAAPVVLAQAPPQAIQSMPQPTLANYKKWAGVGNVTLNPAKLHAESTRSTVPQTSSSLPVMAVDIDILKPTRSNIQTRTSTVISDVRAPAASAWISASSEHQTIPASASNVSRSSVSTTPNSFHQRSPHTPLSTLPKSTAPLVGMNISPAGTSRNSMAKPVAPNSLLAASGTFKKVHAVRNGLLSTKKKDQKADDDGDDEMFSSDDVISAFKKVGALRGSQANTGATALTSPAADAHSPSPPPPTPVQKVFPVSAESRDKLQGTGALDSANLPGYDTSFVATLKDAQPESMSGVEMTEDPNRFTDERPAASGTVEKTTGPPQEAQADDEPSPAESGSFIKPSSDGGFRSRQDSPMSESDSPLVPTDNDAEKTIPADPATNIATDQSSTAAVSDTQVFATNENEFNTTADRLAQSSQEAKVPLGASANAPPTQDAAMATHDPTGSPSDSRSGAQQPQQGSEPFSPAPGVSQQDTTATQSEQASTPAVDTPTLATSGTLSSSHPAPAAHGSTSNDAASPVEPHHRSAPLGTATLEETDKVSTTNPSEGEQPSDSTNTPASIPVSHAETALDDDVGMISVQEVDKVQKASGPWNFRGLGFSIPREQPAIVEQKFALTSPVIDENPYRSSLADEVMDGLIFSLGVMYLEDHAMEVDAEEAPGGLDPSPSIPQPNSNSIPTAFATRQSMGRLGRSEAANEVLPMDVDEIEIPILLPPKPVPIVQAALAPPVIQPALVFDDKKANDRPAVVVKQSIPVDDEECSRKRKEHIKQNSRFDPYEAAARQILCRKPTGCVLRRSNVHVRPFWESVGPEAFVKTTDLSQDQTLPQETVPSFQDLPRTRERSRRQIKPKSCKARPFPDEEASASTERADLNSSRPSEVAERLEVDQIGSKEPSTSQASLADSVSPSTSWPFVFVQTPLRGLFRRLAVALAV